MDIIEKALEKAQLADSANNLNAAQVHSVEPEPVVAKEPIEPQEPSFFASKPKKTVPGPGHKQVELDWDTLKKSGFLTKEDTNSQKAEEYRIIKRPLIENAIGKNSKDIKNSNLILITSSLPGEGKTYNAINLALSISTEMDKQVLLIDADVARPSVAKALGLKEKEDIGLIDYLEDDTIQFSDIIKDTNVPNLRMIFAGKWHKHSTELLASNRMFNLTQELSQRYPDRIVIFDTPPLLAASQGHVLVGLVGQVVLVIEAEKTLRSAVMESVQILNECDVVLALLNKAQATVERSYYNYGHYAN
ncbi:MAG: protein tyrosine kinase [Methylobacter sp.]|nr:MAG: protein tyrosine kinase [Methylobacter sp.]